MDNEYIHQLLQSDFEGHLDKYSNDTIFQCIFCDFETNDPLSLLYHLNDKHQFIIYKITSLSSLNNYLNHWRSHLPPLIDYEFSGILKKTIDPNDINEKNIRSTLHKMRLDFIMNQHETERTEIIQNIPCLFCEKKFTGTWHQYLQWLFEEHSFNPGRPANLVFIEEFIKNLNSFINKNICFHCYQQFSSKQLLLNHMKKKPNSKIPTETRYDRYYMVNYLEEDRKWLELSNEIEEDIIESLEEGLKDFDETEIIETSCLICDSILQNPNEVIHHMNTFHNFHFEDIQKTLNNDFYKLVRFINYCRKMKKDHKCFICNQNIFDDYSKHINNHEKKIPNNLLDIINNDDYLKPILESDPLLTILEEIE